MPTAWQRAMRRGQLPTRRKFQIASMQRLREGAYRIDVNGGSLGHFTVRVYNVPSGRDYVCEQHELTPLELHKLHHAIEVFEERAAQPERFSIFEHRQRGLVPVNAGAAESSVAAAIHKADALVPKHLDVSIRGEYTSDGSYHGAGRGRMVALRERGRWSTF